MEAATDRVCYIAFVATPLNVSRMYVISPKEIVTFFSILLKKIEMCEAILEWM